VGLLYLRARWYGPETMYYWSPDSEYLVYERLEDWNEDGFEESKIWVLRVGDGARWVVSSVR